MKIEVKEGRQKPDFGAMQIKEVKPTGDEKQDFHNAMVALQDNNYEAFIDDLNTLATDQKVKNLRDAIIDRFNSPNGVSVKFSSPTAISIKKIHPTQFEVDMEKSLNFPLKKNPSGIDIAFSGEPVLIMNNPLVVAKVKGVIYIIDGHHRWSQVYCLNPNAQMVVRIIESDMFNTADDVLKLVQMQLFIAKDGGELPSATVDSEYNLYTIGEAAFKKWCQSTMSEDAQNTFAKYIKEDPIDYMWNNVLIMRSQARPTKNAHGRGDMPQTDQVDGEFMKPNATPVSEETNTMKKLNITKERFEKSKYFTRKYGTLEYVNESGNLYKTTKDKVLMFKESVAEATDPALVCPYCGGNNCEISIGTDDLNFTTLDRLQGKTFNIECWCNDCNKPYNVTIELNVKDVYPNEDEETLSDPWKTGEINTDDDGFPLMESRRRR